MRDYSQKKSAQNDSVEVFCTELQWHTDYHKDVKDMDDCFFCKTSFPYTFEQVLKMYAEEDER